MNRLHDPDVFDDRSTGDREISLGTPTILGIFFLLALLCACFFGAGYTMGRKSIQPVALAGAPLTTTIAGAPKPTAGSPAASKTPANVPSTAVVIPTAAPTPQAAPVAATPVAEKVPPATPPQPATSNQQPAGSFMVQVAAVSSQDVADIELAALKKDGYAVVVRHEPTDSLLHIQIGPFATRKDADAMRQRVIADGFNAIVK